MLSIFIHVQSLDNEESESDSRQTNDANFDLIELQKSPPLLFCLSTLLKSIDMDDVPSVSAIEAVEALSAGALTFCLDKRR